MLKNKAGVCPKCGYGVVDYDAGHYDGDYVFHECVCRKCGHEFTEVFKVVYDGYNEYDPETKVENLYDKNGVDLAKGV